MCSLFYSAGHWPMEKGRIRKLRLSSIDLYTKKIHKYTDWAIIRMVTSAVAQLMWHGFTSEPYGLNPASLSLSDSDSLLSSGKIQYKIWIR